MLLSYAKESTMTDSDKKQISYIVKIKKEKELSEKYRKQYSKQTVNENAHEIIVVTQQIKDLTDRLKALRARKAELMYQQAKAKLNQ